MASARVFKIDPLHRPAVAVKDISSDAAEETGRILQENHNDHHVYFSERGFHDHIAHHTLSLYALGASPAQSRKQFDHNATYQSNIITHRDPVPAQPSSVADYDGFMASLTKHDKYKEFLDFFTKEIDENGVLATLDKYVFADDPRAKTMFSRLGASILHPIIHLGLALEFNQPAMVAEALAWTALHNDELGVFLKAVSEKKTGHEPQTNLVDLFNKLHAYQSSAKTALPYNDFSPARHDKFAAIDDGALASIIATYRVTEENVEARIYEAINVEAWVMLAAQRHGYVPKFDFFLIHGHNGTVYLPSLLKVLGPKRTARLVEVQVQASLMEYLSIGAMSFDLEYLRAFVADPSKQGGSVYNNWNALFSKSCVLPDDGHVSKAIRALKGAENVAGKQSTFVEPLKKADILPFAGVLMRSLENEKDFVAAGDLTNQWVRKCGWEEAWVGVAKVE